MKNSDFRIIFVLLLIAATTGLGYAQTGTSSALVGTVHDQSGGVIPGANVVVTNDSTGAQYTAITADNGTFMIPALNAGTYTAKVSMPSFKQSITKNIVLAVGVTTNLTITLQVGGSTETVTVTAGAEVVQASQATVSTTLMPNQINSLPLQTRNSLDFLVFLPGANTTGQARNSTFMGMPNTFLNITVDGISTQDGYNKDSDGFYSMITVRPDAIQEVTVSEASAGADSSGFGAVQIKFVTRGGDNTYHGSLYDYERNTALNSAYWFNNRDQAPLYWGDGQGYGQPCTPTQLVADFNDCKAARNRLILHQAGGRFGGPITIPKIFSGKDKAFFFINLERFMMPTSETRNQTIYAPSTEQGIYSYLYGSGTSAVVETVDLRAIAAASGYTSTIDPDVARLLSQVRAAVQKTGTLQSYPINTNPLYQTYIWTDNGMETRNYMTSRLDFNLTSKHRLEGSFNGETRLRDPDTVNSGMPAYPGFPNYGTNRGIRGTVSFAGRSTITPRITNEARVGFSIGDTLWYSNVPTNIANGGPNGPGGIGDLGGYFWTPSGMSSISEFTGGQRRNAPNKTFEDTVSWSKGTHTLSFGGRFMHEAGWMWNSTFAPSIGFGIPSGYDPAYAMFDSTNASKNIPLSSSSQQSAAASLYASLTARVTSIGGSAYVDEKTGKYADLGNTVQRSSQNFFALFAQDSWRMFPNFTLTLGARWEVNLPWTPLNNSYAWSTPAETWGLSGVNSLFKPGATGGVPSISEYFAPGSPAYDTYWKAINPSVGFAWSPHSKGFLGKILGDGNTTVIRSGFSISYNNYDISTFDSMFFSNPGGNVYVGRNQTLGNLVGTGSNGISSSIQYPLMFRDRPKSIYGPAGTGANISGLLDLAPLATPSPVYPITASIANSINSFEPNIRTPYTMSWQFGIQREISKDMALEVRYVATRTRENWFQSNLNEIVQVENGWLAEFRKMQGNLYAQIAATGKGTTFAYNPSIPGSVPLPITLKFLSPTALDPSVAANYTSAVLGSTQSAVFTSSTNINYLNNYAPASGSMASVMYSDATKRANALANGLPANFFMVNPQVQSGGAWIYKNGGGSQYDSMVVELRRRLARGLLVQANYVWAKAFNATFISWRAPWQHDRGATLPQAFKLNWVYEFPLGQGRALFAGANKLTDRIIGGWELDGTSRIQSGNILDFGNVNLVGMTDQDLKNAVDMNFDDVNKKIWSLPADIRNNSYLAYQYTATGFTSTPPTGRYIAPAGTGNGGNCYQVVAGDCAPRHHYISGPMFTRWDMSLVKRIRFTESKNFELRGEFLNAFNNINFQGINLTPSSTSFGLTSSAYSDSSNSQDPGGRMIQIVLRFNF